MSQTPTVGRIVHYTLTEHDATAINKRRADAEKNRTAIFTSAAGYVAHAGNQADAGHVVPLIITRVWTDTTVNGQLLLDGNDTLWKTSAVLTDGVQSIGRWAWPARG